MRIVLGAKTGSIEMADQCSIVDLTDDFDLDGPESDQALRAMPSQSVVGYDEMVIAVRLALAEQKIAPEVQNYVLVSLGEIFDQVY